MITKLTSLREWVNYMDFDFVNKIKSIGDLEKLYDYCEKQPRLEFCDEDGFANSYNDDDEDDIAEERTIRKEITELLGYNPY